MTDPVKKQRKWAGKLAREIGVSLDDFLDELDFEDEEDDEPSELDDLYENLTAQINHVVAEGEGHATLVPGSTVKELEVFLGDVASLRDTLEKGDLAALQGIVPNVNALPHRLRDIKAIVEARLLSDAEALETELLAATPPAGYEAGDMVPFDAARNAALVFARARPVEIDCFAKARKLMEDASGKITEEIKERVNVNASLRIEAAEVPAFGILTSQIKRYTDALALITAALAAPITSAKNISAREHIRAIEALRITIAQEVVAMGGEENARDINDAFGDSFASIETSLGGAAAMGDLLNLYKPDQLADLIKSFGGGKEGAEALKDMVTEFGSGANAQKAISDLGQDKLKAMKDDAGSFKEVADLYEGLGPATMTAMFDEHGTLTQAQEVMGGFGDDTSLLLALVKDSGLAGQPKALVALLTPSADNKSSDIAKMVNKFDTKEKRERLGGMVDAGGLGDHPEVFGELVKQAGGDGMVAMATAFKDDSQRLSLKRALNEGGLAQPGVKPQFLGELFNNCATGDGKAKGEAMADILGGLTDDSRGQMKTMMKAGGVGQAPKTFAVLVRDGCGGDPAALNALLKQTDSDAGRTGMKALLSNAGMDGSVAGGAECMAEMLKASGTDDDTRAAGFAGLVKGIDGPIATNFKTMIDTGGLGGHPKVLAPLIVKGCGNDATKLGPLAAGISGSPTSQANLAGLLNTGGFGAKDASYAVTNTDPECFAALFETGCGGSPVELVKLLDVMGATQQTQMCNLMKDGELGKHPKVLANMYKHGCLTDGQANATGPKNPAKLLTVLGDFATSGPLFKELMTTGGFGAGPEERLGSVMRRGFTNKGTGVADLTQLKVMATAFTGATEMAKLNTMLNAMETAPAMALTTGTAEALQPGGGLQNILAWDGHNGSAANLNTKFYAALAPASRAVPRNQSPNLTLAEKIQTAASFEAAPVTPALAESHIVTASGDRIDVRADHILVRHTRKYQDFSDVKPRNSLFPAGMDAADIDALGSTAVANIPVAPLRRIRSHGFPLGTAMPNPTDPKRRPPIDMYDLNRPGSAWPADGVNSGGGYTVKVGFKPSDLTGGAGRVMLDQLFPDNADADPNVLGVNQADMRKIRDSLKA